MKSLGFFLSLALLVISTACSKHEPSGHGSLATGPLVRVHASVLKSQEAPVFTEVSGTVRPVDRAVLASKIMGVIVDLPITLGQPVRAGDVLLSINAGEIAARLAQTKSQLNLAQRDLERERDLLQKQASTAEMVRSLEDRYAMTQAMVKEAEAMLAYTIIRAPFDGVISRKHVNAGDLAAPGLPLIEVEGTSKFEIEAQIPESIALKLHVGALAGVEIGVSGLSFEAKVSEISPSSDAQARNVLAKLEVPSGVQVRSGQYARLRLVSGTSRMLLCPASAVSSFGQMERIFVIKDGRASLRLVRTGASRGSQLEILSGLNEGEQFLSEVPAGLREGQAVEVQP